MSTVMDSHVRQQDGDAVGVFLQDSFASCDYTASTSPR